MRINRANGTIQFASGTMTPLMSQPELQRSVTNGRLERWFVNGPFETYRFFPEPGVVATADFRDGHMLNVSLTFELPDDAPDNVSMAHELKRKEKHDAWLREHLGEPPYRYNWGVIESVFYHQHCGSEITVSYQPGHAGT